jgi:hypothetical protein
MFLAVVAACAVSVALGEAADARDRAIVVLNTLISASSRNIEPSARCSRCAR